MADRRAPLVKFCGLTRAADAAAAAALGADFAGAIFAHGPRLLDVERARAMFAGLGTASVKRVGVFGAKPVDEVLAIANGVALDVLQLHDGATLSRVLTLREGFTGQVWAVLRVAQDRIVPLDAGVMEAVDAVVLDTAVGGKSGGTGIAFDWKAMSGAVVRLQASKPVIVAGGLRPSNVIEAVRALAPWAVDVSSGVESAPGIKDHALMRAFAESARRREE